MGTITAADRLNSPDGRQPEELRFVAHADFGKTTEDEMSAPPGKLYRSETAAAPPTRQTVYAHASLLNGLQRGRLLTPDGERHLFRLMNWLRFRAHEILGTMHPSRPSRKKQQEVDRLLQRADMVREQIAEANLRLVASVAGRVSNSPEEFDEFVAEGNTILLNAIDLFDFSRGYRFSTYATHAVQRRLYRLISQRSKKSHREFTSDGDILAELPGPEPETWEPVGAYSLANRIVDAMDETLDEREQLIVRARFGLDGTGEGKTLRKLSDQLGLSKERIRQLLQRAISKLSDSYGHLGSELVA